MDGHGRRRSTSPGGSARSRPTARRYPFHCTAIADGTRTIEVGTAVTFEVRPAGMGRWEATAITQPASAARSRSPRASPARRRASG